MGIENIHTPALEEFLLPKISCLKVYGQTIKESGAEESYLDSELEQRISSVFQRCIQEHRELKEAYYRQEKISFVLDAKIGFKVSLQGKDYHLAGMEEIFPQKTFLARFYKKKNPFQQFYAELESAYKKAAAKGLFSAPIEDGGGKAQEDVLQMLNALQAHQQEKDEKKQVGTE